MSNTVPEKWCLIIDGVFLSPFLSIDFHLNWVPVQQMPLSQVIQSNKIHILTHKGDSLGNNPFWFRDDKILLISSPLTFSVTACLQDREPHMLFSFFLIGGQRAQRVSQDKPFKVRSSRIFLKFRNGQV